MEGATLQVASILIGMLGMFVANVGIIWHFRKETFDTLKEFRRESREDWVRCQNSIDAIRVEMKDFHERLLKIEMERK